MIKKLNILVFIVLSLIVFVGCQEDAPKEIILPNLNGMSKIEALNVLSSLDIQVTFEDFVDNSKPEGRFHRYETGFQSGMVVEPKTQVTIYFVAHETLNGERLPDFTGLTETEINAILINMDVNYSFVEYQTKSVEEGTFAGFAGNYQPGMIVPFFTNIVVRIGAPVISNQLIITTYVESLTNKAIQIMNRSTEPIDLSEYRISIYSNGSETVSISIPLTGILAPNAVLVIANDKSQPELLSKADLITDKLVFDGNDVVSITFRNGKEIDKIGILGFSFFYMKNETFVRKSHITEGSIEYSILDWDIYASNNFSMLGSHPHTYPILTMVRFNEDQTLISFNQPGGMVKVSYDFANDGDTSTFYSLDDNFDDFLGGQRVRFVGIDAPEMNPPQPFAAEATQYLRNILENATVIYLMHDPSTGQTETYGRTLALVWADGLLVNLEMVRMGFSSAGYFDDQQRLVFNGVSLNRLFERAEQEARANRRGIWS